MAQVLLTSAVLLSIAILEMASPFGPSIVGYDEPHLITVYKYEKTDGVETYTNPFAATGTPAGTGDSERWAGAWPPSTSTTTAMTDC